MKYKGFLLATTGGLAAMSGAQAADLPMKAARVMPAPVPVASWDGFYVGLNAGANWQHANATPNFDYAASPNNIKGYGSGFIGGGQIGYNWQFASSWVFGLEADISGLTGTATGNAGLDTGKGNALESRINWLSTFRARAGWLMNQDTLLYVTGGLAVGGVKGQVDPNGLYGNLDTTKSVSTTRTGWTVGGGMEHMLNRNWTVGLEALYVDLGNSTGNAGTGTKTSNFKNTAVIGRLKVNYKF